MTKGTIEKVELHNGVVVNGKESWTTTEKVPNQLCVGWESGAAPHFSLSESRIAAITGKYPELVLGNYEEISKTTGKIISIPVVDTEAMKDLFFAKADEGLGIEVQRIATSRIVASTKLNAGRAAVEAMDLDPEVKAAILASFK